MIYKTMMQTQQTKIDAYYSEQLMFNSLREKVYWYLDRAGGGSINTVARALMVERSTISPRIHELRRMGKVIQGGVWIDPQTNKKNIWWVIKK